MPTWKWHAHRLADGHEIEQIVEAEDLLSATTQVHNFLDALNMYAPDRDRSYVLFSVTRNM